jgi:hypothetical protein
MIAPARRSVTPRAPAVNSPSLPSPSTPVPCVRFLFTALLPPLASQPHAGGGVLRPAGMPVAKRQPGWWSVLSPVRVVRLPQHNTNTNPCLRSNLTPHEGGFIASHRARPRRREARATACRIGVHPTHTVCACAATGWHAVSSMRLHAHSAVVWCACVPSAQEHAIAIARH